MVENKLNKWHDWLVDYVPKPIKNSAGKTFSRAKNSILGLYDGAKNALKGGVGNQKQAEDNTDLTTHEYEWGPGDNYIRGEMPFNSLMTELLEAGDINDLIQRMLAYIKTQTENPKFCESGFTLDKIMHMYINFHRLALTRGGSCIEWPEWLKDKKAMINRQNKDKDCFKWAVIAALHHEDIKHHPDRISLLRTYESQHNWKGLEFPVSIKKIDKFEKNNPGIAVNVLCRNKSK